MLDKFDSPTDKVVKNIVSKNKDNPEFTEAGLLKNAQME